MKDVSFNLVNKSWIPCRMKSNELKELSIKEVLFNTIKIKQIAIINPIIDISLHRFLLAILHRNFGPKDRNTWRNIYKNKGFDQNVLNSYFSKWLHKFELFNEPEHRFYQIKVPEIKNITPISKLNPALSSGNTSALFDHNWDSLVSPLEIEQAARLLISYQNFSLGGGKSIPFNYSSAPLTSSIIIMLKGTDLFETLMLNFIQYDKNHPFSQSETHEDIPFWERSDKSLCEDKDGRYPYGYLDYLTWQSRRVWLIPEIDEEKITVKEIYMAQGEKVSKEWNEDPMKPYRMKNNEKIAIKLQKDRKVWRDAESLLRLKAENSNYTPPEAINWISRLVDMKLIAPSRLYNLELYGLDSNKAKIDSWHHSYIPLSLKFLSDQSLVNTIQSFIKKCEQTEDILLKTIELYAIDYFFPNVENLKKNQWNKINEFKYNTQISIKYWNSIESYFYKFLEEIVQEPDYKKRVEIINFWIKEEVINVARNLLNNLKNNLKNDPRALKPIIQKLGYFFTKIKSI